MMSKVLKEKSKRKKELVVVTDSASDVPKEYAKKLNISIVPLYIFYNGNEYRDGIDINSEQIYSLQKEKKAIFTSSSPSPYDFIKVYKRLLEKYNTIISIHLSSKLSAVIKSANIAKDLLKAGKRILIFDSLSATMGTGFMSIVAAKAIAEKYSLEKIKSILKFIRKNIRLYGTIDTLKYLRRSGRVPAVASTITSALKIKPILGISDGIVGMWGIAITRWGSLIEITKRAIGDFRNEKWVVVAIIHSLALDESKKIMKKIQASLNCVDSIITECTPVVGAHTGPGLVGIIISKVNRDIAELFI